MNFILKALGWICAWLIFGFALFLGIVWFNSYDPPTVEKLPVGSSAEVLRKDTIKVVSWNVGYAGLGADMDFFYDGGQSVRTSLGRTESNLRAIVRFLKANADADFIMLQEVDLNSKRSYGINQYDTILNALGREFKGFVGLNFVSPFVPIPITEPIGKVSGGVATFSRYNPCSAVRYAYPGGFDWPMSMFNLKRCLLTLEIPISDSLTLYLNNTHNTAYDKGGMRQGEFEFLRTMFVKTPYFIVAGDWNSTPPLYKATKAELSDENFSPMPISADFFPSDWRFAYDPSTHTARYGYEPYDSLTTTRTTIDFAMAGPRVEPISVECVDLGFENSDHNPIIYKFVIKR